MKKALFLITLSTLLICTAKSQDTIYLGKKHRMEQNKHPDVVTDRPPQAVYGELYGRGIVFSFNYDTRFQKTLNGIGCSVGAGAFFVGDGGFVTVPVSLNYLAGNNGHYFETATGFTYASATFSGFGDGSSGGSTVLGTLTFGYRSQPVKGGLNFRAGLNFLGGSGIFIPYPYISLGYNF